MAGAPDSTPNFQRGRWRGLIIFVVVMVVGVAIVFALSGVFKEKRRKSNAEENADNQEAGGCPCQCDRSEDMANELRSRNGEEAHAAIDESLRTIAEREALGYVTEAMIQHRLRLLDLERELEPSTAGARLVPHAGLPIDQRAVEDASLRARMELVVHGQINEWVNDRQKLQSACFVLSMEIENLKGDERLVRKPTIEASVSFPISRWYVRGSMGEPWDGKLEPREKKSVYAIGYLGSAVSPKTKVDADIHFESLSVRTSTRALGRWNQPHESVTAAL